MGGEKGNIHTHVHCEETLSRFRTGKGVCLNRRAVFGNTEEPLGLGWGSPHGSYALYASQGGEDTLGHS